MVLRRGDRVGMIDLGENRVPGSRTKIGELGREAATVALNR